MEPQAAVTVRPNRTVGTARKLGVVSVLFSLLAACGGASDESPTPSDAVPTAQSPQPGMVATSRLERPRAAHRATRLANGLVLITGGFTEAGGAGFDAARRAELYDVSTGSRDGPRMSTGRAGGTATLLEDGRVLLTGGYPGEGRPPLATAEVFEPAGSRFVGTDDMGTARADHTATLMPDGRVLLAGGFDKSGTPLATTEFYDPGSGAFTEGPSLGSPRASHLATRVGETVVLVGGTEDGSALASTEVLRGADWRPGPLLGTPRVKHGVVALDDRRVLVAGGATGTDSNERLASTEVLDLEAGSARPGPRLSLGEYKLDGALAVLDDGRVVLPSGPGLAVFDQDSGRLVALPVASYDTRSFRTLTSVGNNQVLVAGGYDDGIIPTDQAILVTVPDCAPGT